MADQPNGRSTLHMLFAIGHTRTGAGNGTRTRDPELGRLALYQLSYSREKWWRGKDSNLRRHRRQIYSLLPLATRVPLRLSAVCLLKCHCDSPNSNSLAARLTSYAVL